MLDWLTSPVFIVLALTLATVCLYRWNKRKHSKIFTKLLRTFRADRGTWTGKAAEAAWITALRESVAKDRWKPGLKSSATENAAQTQLNLPYCNIRGQAETMARPPADAQDLAQNPSDVLYHHLSSSLENKARNEVDPEVFWVHCESDDPKIVKLRRLLVEGKTLFSVQVFPPADHEWEAVHEGQAVLEEVSGLEAKFRLNRVNPWMLFSDFRMGYDRKRKRPLIQFRERL
jgi:hypothetical protein